MKRMIGLLLCALLTLCAAISGAENLTGEVVIDGVTFALDAKVLNPETEMTARYKATGRRWGREPKDFFDIGAVMAEPQDAMNVDCGFEGERMYIVGQTFNHYCDEALRFDITSVEYHTLFGLNRECYETFSYTSQVDDNLNLYDRKLFEGVWRARNPKPEDVPDLEGITYADALAAIEAFKKPFEAGVLIGEPYYVEAWDQESRLADARAAAGGDELLPSEVDAVKAEPDYYVIRLRTTIEDEPALAGFGGLTDRRDSMFDGEDIYVDRSSAIAVVSANGIERFKASPYLEGFEQQGGLSPTLTVQQALDAVRQAQDFFVDRDDFLPGRDMTQFEARIVEIAPELFLKENLPYDGTYTVIPVWAFHVHVRSTGLFPEMTSVSWKGAQEACARRDYYSIFAIDAITGERVL